MKQKNNIKYSIDYKKASYIKKCSSFVFEGGCTFFYTEEMEIGKKRILIAEPKRIFVKKYFYIEKNDGAKVVEKILLDHNVLNVSKEYDIDKTILIEMVKNGSISNKERIKLLEEAIEEHLINIMK